MAYILPSSTSPFEHTTQTIPPGAVSPPSRSQHSMTNDIPYYENNENPAVVRLFVIRHGQTDANVQKILQGHMDTDLNETGHNQAHLLGEYLANQRKISFDKIYSSDLKRCQQTIASILSHYDTPSKVVTSSTLRERSMGIIEGMYLSDAEAYAESQGKPSFRDFGEPAQEFHTRLTTSIKSILQENPLHKNIALISHGGSIRQIIKWLNYTELNANKIIVFNTSVTIIDYIKDSDQLIVRRVGNTQHLGDGEFIVSDLKLR